MSTEQRLAGIVDAIAGGGLGRDAAVAELLRLVREAPYEDLGFARVDHHREARQGFPEVVFGPGKTPAQVAEIAARIVARGHALLVTKVGADVFEAVRAQVPDVRYEPLARAVVRPSADRLRLGRVAVVAAGTSDLPVAEEAAVTAEVMGHEADRLYDVGVAGLHRLLGERERLEEADVVIVVAGMEGALPSVVGGLVSAPVVAVPTSVGYGASFGGVAALLGMLNSCASGVGVVNIDNGFGAAALASRIARVAASRKC